MNNDNGILTAAYENTREAAFLPVLAGDDPYNDMVYLLLKDDEPVAAIQHHLDVEDAQVHAMILALGLTECMSDALVSAVQDVMFTDAGGPLDACGSGRGRERSQRHLRVRHGNCSRERGR